MSESPDSKEGNAVENGKEAVSIQSRAIDQLDGLPVDEFEEEVDVNGKIERHKGVYILPNLFTTAALFTVYSILRFSRKIGGGGYCDFCGHGAGYYGWRVARMVNAQSKFGAEYDSLLIWSLSVWLQQSLCLAGLYRI